MLFSFLYFPAFQARPEINYWYPLLKGAVGTTPLWVLCRCSQLVSNLFSATYRKHNAQTVSCCSAVGSCALAQEPTALRRWILRSGEAGAKWSPATKDQLEGKGHTSRQPVITVRHARNCRPSRFFRVAITSHLLTQHSSKCSRFSILHSPVFFSYC